jgi:hypothetical protein
MQRNGEVQVCIQVVPASPAQAQAWRWLWGRLLAEDRPTQAGKAEMGRVDEAHGDDNYDTNP